MATPFDDQLAILADLWINYKDNEELEDFIEYNDLGLPLAYLIHTGLAEPTDGGAGYIDETFNLLITALGLDIEGEYESLNEILSLQEDEEE
jgi:hypothetical protein